MGKDTAIGWTDDTWNPAVGCSKVSAGCRGCYMMRDQARYGRDGSVVRRTAPGAFDLPVQRDRQGAWKLAPGRLVFVASLTDVFHPDLDGFRDEVWARMERRPDLLFLVLTKRPERIAGRLPAWWGEYGPANVALGVSAEDQAAWDARVPILRSVRARLRFVSVEPMIGPISNPHGLSTLESYLEHADACGLAAPPEDRIYASGIGWVIIGGESGPLARPMHPRWAKDLIQACEASSVPVYFKQWGQWKPISDMTEPEYGRIYRSNRKARDGEDQGEIDDIYGKTCTVPTLSLGVNGEHLDLRHPQAFWTGRQAMQAWRVGTRASGRVIDGRTYDHRPTWPLELP